MYFCTKWKISLIYGTIFHYSEILPSINSGKSSLTTALSTNLVLYLMDKKLALETIRRMTDELAYINNLMCFFLKRLLLGTVIVIVKSLLQIGLLLL